MGRNGLRIVVLTFIVSLLLSVFPLASASAEASNNQLIVINKSTNKLAYFNNGELIKTFSVATGRTSTLTPEGSFPIVNKIKNRPYYKEKIPGGDPRNPLGDRWLGLEVDGTEGTTYAIHGNNNSKSIGKYVSAGCIRMKNDEIHWLFPQIEIGTLVVITSSEHTLTEIAEAHGYPVMKNYEGKLLVNGEPKDLENAMFIADSRVFIPMREVFELLGAEVTWDDATKTVTAVIGDRTLTHTIQSTTVDVNGEALTITASKLVANKVLLPLRNISELIGYNVEWDSTTKEIRITK
ncbi:L,D-transpeptidase family protein [Paenibacillus sp. DLE-14]|uniref:L,D-transpeptidase family protein n=1 Tax=Paenibacillus lignilyticus TaxID=1172615 RepID=A0ABS5CDN7_9BACL|nr:L,D-transpeptidase family protein [Paenibacillus lignilyticus]